MRVAIVEDEMLIALFLKDCIEDLTQEPSDIPIFDTGSALFHYLEQGNNLDLVLMDIQINGDKDGIQIANQLKKDYPSIYTIFVTSFKDSDTIQRAKISKPLGYLIKPISQSDIESILMVAENFVDGMESKSLDTKNIYPYTYNLSLHELRLNNLLIQLTPQETICLEIFINHKNQHIKQEYFIENIWGNEDNRLASLRELIHRLRKKLPELNIQNVSKVGYILSPSLLSSNRIT